jgi:hypothetical protein
MANPNVLKHASWLGVVALFLVFMSCRDFDAAYDTCTAAGGACTGDGSTTDGGGTTNDGGTTGDGGSQTDGGADAGTQQPPDLDGGTCYSAVGLCLLNKYEALYNTGASGFIHALWGSAPNNVFFATDDGKRVVRYNGTSFSAPTDVTHLAATPFRMQGTSSNNVWAINRMLDFDCGGDPYSGSSGSGNCELPVIRFNGSSWTGLPSTDGGPLIQPPALYTTGYDSTWVATSNGHALRWDGNQWIRELSSAGDDFADQIMAFWGPDPQAPPTLAVGQAGDYMFSSEAGFWRRQSNGTWEGPSTITLSPTPPPLKAIAGPNLDHLYAVGGFSNVTVLRWDVPSTRWKTENQLLPNPLPNNGQPREVMDLWVSSNGTDVWIALNTSYVLRKVQDQWSVLQLPLHSQFRAVQVEGFDNGELWITGYIPHGNGPESGTYAYRFYRLPP